MYLKRLEIKTKTKGTIRDIHFSKGINLLVDDTPSENSNEKSTGNNVGKTTVLKLIDFCLGATPQTVYSDEYNKKGDEFVKKFLEDEEVLIILTLKENINIDSSQEIVIQRNFLSGKAKKILKINGKTIQQKDFEQALNELIIPTLTSVKPTFRQVISHNFRYKDTTINNPLKTLHHTSRTDEYEALHLFLFGCNFQDGEQKQFLNSEIELEEKYKKRLLAGKTKNSIESALKIVCDEITELEKQKTKWTVDEKFEENFTKMNRIEIERNAISSRLTDLKIRKNIISEAVESYSDKRSNIDMIQLELIYSQATDAVGKLQKTFDDLVQYHNKMVDEKIKFVKKDLPEIEKNIEELQMHMQKANDSLKEIKKGMANTRSFEDYESLLSKINLKYAEKGAYEESLKKITEIEIKISALRIELNKINDDLYSLEFENKVKAQLGEFNKEFVNVSKSLYDEKYMVTYEIKTSQATGRKYYEFTTDNAFLSSGKKQGEISCFDIAYILFADKEKIPCLHFILNDKKELLHDNQLLNIQKFIEGKDIQFIASILKDKLPEQLKKKEYYSIELSQDDKLFRIESFD